MIARTVAATRKITMKLKIADEELKIGRGRYLVRSVHSWFFAKTQEIFKSYSEQTIILRF